MQGPPGAALRSGLGHGDAVKWMCLGVTRQKLATGRKICRKTRDKQGPTWSHSPRPVPGTAWELITSRGGFVVLYSWGIWGSAGPGTGTELRMGLSLCTCLESGAWGQPKPAGEVPKFTCTWVSALFASSRAAQGAFSSCRARARVSGLRCSFGLVAGAPRVRPAPGKEPSCAVHLARCTGLGHAADRPRGHRDET